MRRNLRRGSHSETIDHRLSVYSLTALAASVSVLALSQPASANVVVTKKKIPLLAGRNVLLDLNYDGIPDFKFEPTSSTYRIGSLFVSHQTLVMKALTGGKAVGRNFRGGGKGPYASALVRGAKIGPSAHFSSSNGQIAIERYNNNSRTLPRGYGYWSYYVDNNRFLGVKFQIKGETHYGWVRLERQNGLTGSFPPAIIGYAYETVANKPITAGATSETGRAEAGQKALAPSLGMLALGGDGLVLWRRDEEIASRA